MARGFSHAPGASAEVLAALDPARSKADLLVLGASKNSIVRAAVAARPDCPLGLMVTLAHDFAVDVRIAVATNDRAQRSVLQYLAADRSLDVLLALLQNPALPADLLDELAFHKKAQVRSAAAARMDTGAPAAPVEGTDEVRIPELMDTVSLFGSRHRASDDGADPASVAGLGEPSTDSDDRGGGGEEPVEAQAVAVDEAHADASQGPHVAQFHHHTDVPLATRTAPVRGFRPRP